MTLYLHTKKNIWIWILSFLSQTKKFVFKINRFFSIILFSRFSYISLSLSISLYSLFGFILPQFNYNQNSFRLSLHCNSILFYIILRFWCVWKCNTTTPPPSIHFNITKNEKNNRYKFSQYKIKRARIISYSFKDVFPV